MTTKKLKPIDYDQLQTRLQLIHEGLDVDNRIVYLHDGVSVETGTRVLRHLRILSSINQNPILLDFQSEGGDVSAGMAIYDAIRRLESDGVRVIGRATGSCESICAVILQACGLRTATQHCFVMYHTGASQIGEKNPYEVQSEANFDARANDRIDRLVYERIANSGYMKTFNEFQRDADHAIYLTADEAIRDGFLDYVV